MNTEKNRPETSSFAGNYIPSNQPLPQAPPENWETRNDHPSGFWAFVNQFDRTKWQFAFPSEAVPLPVLPEGWTAMHIGNEPNRPANYPNYYFLNTKTGDSYWQPPTTVSNPPAPTTAQAPQNTAHQTAAYQSIPQSTAGAYSSTPQIETPPTHHYQQPQTTGTPAFQSNNPFNASSHSEAVFTTPYDESPPAYHTVAGSSQSSYAQPSATPTVILNGNPITVNHSSDVKVSSAFMAEKGDQHASSSSSTVGPGKLTKRKTKKITTASGEEILLPGSDTLEYYEEELDRLRGFDIAVLIDNSGSMVSKSDSGAKSLWEVASLAIAALAPFCTEYDSNGIDLYFLNSPVFEAGKEPKEDDVYKIRRDNIGVRTADEVLALFNGIVPSGVTPLGRRISDITERYMKELEESGECKEKKPLFLLVITDGSEYYGGYGSIGISAEDVIRDLVQRLDLLRAQSRQIGIQFLQIGDDKTAKEYLDKLDNNIQLQGSKRDIVDTVNYTNALTNGGAITTSGLLKIMLGAILKEYDDAGLPDEKGDTTHQGAFTASLPIPGTRSRTNSITSTKSNKSDKSDKSASSLGRVKSLFSRK